MAGARNYIGTGSTIAFGTSTGIGGADFFTALITSIDWSGLERPALDSTDLAVDTTPGSTTFGNALHIPASLANAGELTVNGWFNPDMTPPMVPGTVANSETITLTFPTIGAETAANWAFSGFCKGYDVDCPLDALMTFTMSIRAQGGVTKSAAS